MFAVIKTGGKQHRVAEGDVITVGKLSGDAGAKVEFGEILAIGAGEDVSIGAPFVSGASVAAEIVEHARGEKVIAFKKRRRQNSKRKRGHRQDYTIVKIVGLSGAKN
ncbi:50S ribosomal protein L21 [Methylopila musalis]|uniref:Large ribosomal subunit protein bL21 n=2 Tax=Methylopila TaxID=61653 RepID=A0A9W6JKU3_9HYPH|nr:50S ribosomal protein L21 [Methylopila jiangsuensis]MDR6284657.1 large subunit ribosomal protein L21 [Methylopila jiangsuensis]GLK77954.1 50S ribosomal protein L21 [Methylopila jiangsuensis]